MKQVYFDKGINDLNYYSFCLDFEESKVIFCRECESFIRDLKKKVLADSKDRIISLCVYDIKIEFQIIICREILGLKGGGCFMETALYKIPNDFDVNKIDEIYDFNKMVGILKEKGHL